MFGIVFTYMDPFWSDFPCHSNSEKPSFGGWQFEAATSHAFLTVKTHYRNFTRASEKGCLYSMRIQCLKIYLSWNTSNECCTDPNLEFCWEIISQHPNVPSDIYIRSFRLESFRSFIPFIMWKLKQHSIVIRVQKASGQRSWSALTLTWHVH